MDWQAVCLFIIGVIDNHDGWVGVTLYCLAASVGAMQDLARLSRYPPSHNRVSPAAKLSLTSNPISVHR